MKTIKFDLPNGYKITAIENTKTVFDEIWYDKIYERDFIIKEGMNIVDIGGNQGFFSLYAASKGANVFTFEPEEKNYQLLLENIKNNNLEGNIKAYKFAVTNHEGYLNLFVQDFNEYVASAIVSTSKEFLKNINRYNNRIEIQKAACITLNKLIDKIGINSIDLLKIDCEGAELDILRSASIKQFKKIKNIVMETHSNYKEKDLLFSIKAAGFNIVSYKRILKKSQNGYLFAENNNITERPSWDYPIGVLKGIPYSKIYKKVTLDASGSFSTAKNSDRLIYKWKIDGEAIVKADKPVLKYLFNKAGMHNIELEVIAKNGKSNKINKNFWIIKKSYFNTGEEEIIQNDYSEDKIYAFKGTKYFSIKIPESINPDLIGIGIEYKEPKNYSGILEFNDDKKELKNDFNEIQLLDFPPGLEIKYSVTANDFEVFRIFWWWREFEENILINPEEINQEAVLLKQKNNAALYEVNNKETFLIYHKYLPNRWDPVFRKQKIVIGIAVMGGDYQNLYLEYKNQKESFDSWYKEFRFDLENPDEDIIFMIINEIKSNILKIEWWINLTS